VKRDRRKISEEVMLPLDRDVTTFISGCLSLCLNIITKMKAMEVNSKLLNHKHTRQLVWGVEKNSIPCLE
jgi:hypothetical protein